jgi:hypothetical protein
MPLRGLDHIEVVGPTSVNDTPERNSPLRLQLRVRVKIRRLMVLNIQSRILVTLREQMTNILASGANTYGDRLGLEVSAEVEINCDRDITGDDGVLHSDHHSKATSYVVLYYLIIHFRLSISPN